MNRSLSQDLSVKKSMESDIDEKHTTNNFTENSDSQKSTGSSKIRKLKKKNKSFIRHLKEKKKKGELKRLKIMELAETEHERSALIYLKLWHESRSEWKFQKKLQYWLLKNAFVISKISDDNFSVLLEYIASLKGAAKDRLIQDCQKIIADENQKVLNCSENETQSSTEEEAENSCAITLERARQVLKRLV